MKKMDFERLNRDFHLLMEDFKQNRSTEKKEAKIQKYLEQLDTSSFKKEVEKLLEFLREYRMHPFDFALKSKTEKHLLELIHQTREI